MENPFVGDDHVAFITESSIGDIKTALAGLEGDDLASAVATVRAVEESREDNPPRKGLVTHLETLEPEPESPPEEPPDSGDSNDEPPTEGATEPEPTPVELPSVGEVTVNRDCVLNIEGQTLRCKAGDRLTGRAAAYAVATGAPVTAVDADD